MNLSRNVKLIGLALAAVFAFSALAAGSAQANAPRWTVGGKTIIATESRAFTANSTGNVALELGVFTLMTTASKDCLASGSIVGSGGGAPGTGKGMLFKCSNVELLVGGKKFPNCTVHSPGQPNGSVITNELSSTLVWLEEKGTAKVGETFAPEKGTAVVTLETTGGECPEFIFEKYEVTGNMIATVDPVEKDVTEGTLTFPQTPHKVYWTNQTPTRTKDEDTGLLSGSKAVVFAGTFDFRLDSDELFGVEPG